MPALALSSRYDALKQTFHLNAPEEITTYFPQRKRNISEFAATKYRRIVHWIQTGVWISEKSLFSWLRKDKDRKVSPLFEEKHLYRKIIRCEEKIEVPQQSPFQKLAEAAHFLVNFIRRSKTVGAILPSSEYLAKEIAREIPKLPLKARRRHVLEIGPGTGVFTDKILKKLNPKDTLDLVEYDTSFCKLLKKKYHHLKNVHVYHTSILDYKNRLGKYDHIVSGLPLNSFSPEFVHKYFEHVQKLSHSGTTLSYFEYIILPDIKQIFLTEEERYQFESILEEKKDFYEAHKLREKIVLRNIPPAKVLHHKL